MKVVVRTPSTFVRWLRNRDQLPDLRLVTCNGDPSDASRHRPEILPPFPLLVPIPQVINVVGDFLALLVL